MLSVDNFRIVFAHLSCIRNFIAQFVEGIHDDFKGFTLVMALQVFNVFKNKDGRFFCADNTRHIEEKRSLSLTFETMRAPERVFLAYARKAERLTGGNLLEVHHDPAHAH